jgi:hypothetical protein
MDKTKQTKLLMENIQKVFGEDISGWKKYKVEDDKIIKGYVSTWNKGLDNGEPVVYGVEQDNAMGGGHFYIVISGILSGNELINATEAYDDWFGREDQALAVAKGLAEDENYGAENISENSSKMDDDTLYTTSYGFYYYNTDLNNDIESILGKYNIKYDVSYAPFSEGGDSAVTYHIKVPYEVKNAIKLIDPLFSKVDVGNE